ncbi:MAG: ubiquinone/menaquinone biosynthesis methyltransferase [Chloroflexi bacterium]|nr:ubiquinone/menaquinone biosynthesis methyltransferase [Chloroflexota bacterium]
MGASHPEELFEAGADRVRYVRRMFGEISGRYDLVNRVMTLGRDQSWRRLAARELVRPGDRVVDVGCGTGDLAFACLDAGADAVIGVDFARPMLSLAQAKAARRTARAGAGRSAWLLADGTRLPLPDASVDAWCSAFVVRNIPDLDAALAEARRVLRPQGRLAILEVPRMERGWVRPFARVHFRRVVPLVGRAISGHATAYRYLPVSVDHFLAPSELTGRLRAAGFRVRAVRMLMLGTVALHVAERVAE